MSSSESESSSAALAAASTSSATFLGTRLCFGLSADTQDSSSSKLLSIQQLETLEEFFSTFQIVVNGVNNSSSFFEAFFDGEIVEVELFDFSLCVVLCLASCGTFEAKGCSGGINRPELGFALVK